MAGAIAQDPIVLHVQRGVSKKGPPPGRLAYASQPSAPRELLEEIRQPFLQALANFRQKALLAGKRLTDEEAARWITTGAPRVPYTPGLPESGAALRAAALALSAKAIAIQAQRLKELRAASQIN